MALAENLCKDSRCQLNNQTKTHLYYYSFVPMKFHSHSMKNRTRNRPEKQAKDTDF